jgi:hypothetical protein
VISAALASDGATLISTHFKVKKRKKEKKKQEKKKKKVKIQIFC